MIVSLNDPIERRILLFPDAHPFEIRESVPVLATASTTLAKAVSGKRPVSTASPADAVLYRLQNKGLMCLPTAKTVTTIGVTAFDI